MKSLRVLVGAVVFISLYAGALFAFAVNVAPGTTLDPSGLPGAYTVSVIGYDSIGDLSIEKDFGSGVLGGYQLSDDVLGTGIRGSGVYMTEGTDQNITGVADFGFSSNVSVLHYTDTATNDIVFVGAGKIGGTPMAIMNATNDTSGESTYAMISTGSGFFIQGKDDLNATSVLSVQNESSDHLLDIMADGEVTMNRSVAAGDFTLGTHDFTHPVLGDPAILSGSRLVLAGGESFDVGVLDLDSGATQLAGAHYLSASVYQGFDVTENDASLFSFDIGTSGATAVTVNPTQAVIAASPDGSIFNRITINSSTDGIVFSGLDDLTTSVLTQFENNSGDELLQIKNDGSFVSETTGGFQLVNKTAQSLAIVGALPVTGAFFSDSNNEYVNGLVDFTGLGGSIYSEMAYIDKNTLDSFYVVVDNTAARIGFTNDYGAGANHGFEINSTGAEYSGVDDLSTTEGFRIENESSSTLFSVYNDGTVLLPGTLTTTPVSGINQAGASVTIAGGKATGIAAGGSILFQTSDTLTPPQSTTLQSLTTKLTISAAGNLTIASRDRGIGSAGSVLEIGRNSNATTTGAGSVNFLSKAGTAGYVWQDAAGNMRIHTSAPASANDTSGTVIGAQTSTRETKQDIASYTDYTGALQKIIDAPLHTFRYIKEVEGYGTDSLLAKTRIGYIADEVAPEFMVGNVIDQVTVNGLLMASVKELNLKISPIEELASNGSFVINLRTFFADATNNIGDFFANRVHTKTICLSDDSGGEETCITKSTLDTLLQNAAVSGGSDSSSGGDVVTDVSEPETEELTQPEPLEEVPAEENNQTEPVPVTE